MGAEGPQFLSLRPMADSARRDLRVQSAEEEPCEAADLRRVIRVEIKEWRK